MAVFAGIDIYLPEKYREYFQTYCQTRADGRKNSALYKPFPRMVDMWFLAVCVAVCKGLKPELRESRGTYKAIDGAVFASDEWREKALQLIALETKKDVKILNDPREVMRIANGYALAGLPLVIEALESSGGEAPLDTLSDFVEELIRERVTQ